MEGDSDAIRVLCVDDDRDFTETFIDRLGRCDGFEADTATDASEGIGRLAETDFDCVVAAYDLPEGTGIEFLETVRDRGLGLPFFLFAGEGSEEIASNAISAGVTDYFGKDSGIEQFPAVRDRIDRAVETFRTDRERDATRRRYRELVEQNLVGIYVIRDGEFVYVNPKLAEVHGYDRESVVGMSVLDLVAPEERERVEENLQRRLEQGVDEIQYRTVGLTKDGERIDIELHGSRIEYGGEPEIVGAELDITEQTQYERELENREAKYRSLFEDARDAVVLLDEDGFFDCNERALELFGFDSVEAFTERTPWELSPETQPDGADSKTAAKDHIEAALEEGEASFEWVHTRNDGTEFPVEVKLSRFYLDGDPVLHELVRDITERKQYERTLEEQRDTLEILNQVLRHDVRNDLQLVTSYAELLKDSCDGEEASQHAATVLESARHAVELTQTARDIADVLLSDSSETRRVPLGATLESKISEIRSSYPEPVISYEARLSSVHVTADGMFPSVFENLIKNAIQHNDKAVPEVTITATERDGAVTVRIADNGPGIPDEQKETVFGKGRKGLDSAGTGMGLYLVDTLVTGYGGEVWVEDNEPEGSVFVVKLPTVE
ncbi:receiver/sensor box histidine kinase [Natronomonas moolapensis 8.8.11]|uniref:histidine kinase n=1 Tax=Natronomonas moolapensis (strain DSM 18674 / CECT 7526 / JCM 14361 / 8.8.11) TaxID=268739 RepID=M1XQR8_NATM8|nr:PAS domain S-box protein [Natronomonas moolapensis]CCQ36507.1 receiver/sensor box histidine kinase [Natronomonas moolapensis 8.8.11]